MSLDDARNALHAAMLENEEHPHWAVVEQQERERAAAARENAELAAMESPEAEGARWSYRFRRRAIELPTVHYVRD